MMTLKVIREGGLSYIGEANTPHDVYMAMKFIETADREEFYVLHLDAKNNIQSAELISMGTLNRVLIHPREVYKGAILNNSASIILVHNHPSGEPKPSEEDIAITHRLMAAGDIIGIKILDHVIIGDGEWVGLISEGRLRKEIKEPIVLDSQEKRKAKKADKKPINVLEFDQNKSKNHEKTDNKLPPYLAELLEKVEFIYYEGTLNEKCMALGPVVAVFDEIFRRKKSNQRNS